ncbi:excalibur calcium-binding domain-containing protein [Aminobacter carboxidus]|nr:excalibur calcium-binding domain-containing protein [Aminobacter carboxidus]
MELRQTCMRIGSILGIWIITSGNAGATARAELEVKQGLPITLARARTCKQVSSCAEAVELWCGGYRRADADNDGIPCENVCPTKELVDELRQQIGC